MAGIGQLMVELGINAGAFVEGIDKATYKSKQAAKEIGDSFKGIGRDISGLLGQFGAFGGAAGEALSDAGETIAKLAGQFGSIGGAAGAAAIGISIAGAAAVAAGAGLMEMAVQGAELVHNLSMVSQKTGISIQDLQGLQAAGGTVGLSLDSMVMGFRKFDQAITGSGRASGATGAILRSLNVTARSNEEALNQVADAFQRMQNGPEKAADAIALFGRAGLNLIPLLNKGRAGIQEFNDMVQEYGTVVGEDAVKANEDYLTSQAKLTLGWDAAKISAEREFLPMLAKITTAMADLSKGTSDYINTLAGMSWGDVANFWSAGLVGKQSLNDAPTNSGNANLGDKAKAAAHDKIMHDLSEELRAEQAGGQAAAELAKVKESIADAQRGDSEVAKRQAIEDQKRIPALEKAAALEKSIVQYKLEQATHQATPKNDVADALTKLHEQTVAQTNITSSVNDTADSRKIDAAIQEENAKLADKQRELTEKIAAKVTELQNKYKGGINPHAAADVVAMQKELDLVTSITYQEKSRAEVVAKVSEASANAAQNKLTGDITELQAQSDELDAVAAAWLRGGKSAVAFEQSLKSEKKSLEESNQALADYIAVAGLAGEQTASLTEKRDAAQAKYNKAAALAGDNQNKSEAQKIQEATDALAGEATAYAIVASAAFGSAQAQQIAAASAAAAKVKGQGGNQQQQDLAYNEELQKQTQSYADEVTKLAVSFSQSTNELTKYSEARARLIQQGQSTLLIDAAIVDQQEKLNKEWDDAALKSTNLGNITIAVFDEVAQEGKNMFGSLAQDGKNALDGLNDQFAKFAATGKLNLKSVGTNLIESTTKSSLRGLEGAGLAMIPGLNLGNHGAAAAKQQELDAQKRNTDALTRLTQAIENQSENGGGDEDNLTDPNVIGDVSDFGKLVAGANGAGGGALAAAGGIGSLFTKVLSVFGGFLEGGGDVTPGKTYIVGEKHPEFFTPGQSGQIAPSLKVHGGGSTQVNVHFHGVQDHDSFKRNRSQIAAELSNAVGRGTSRIG